MKHWIHTDIHQQAKPLLHSFTGPFSFLLALKMNSVRQFVRNIQQTQNWSFIPVEVNSIIQIGSKASTNPVAK